MKKIKMIEINSNSYSFKNRHPERSRKVFSPVFYAVLVIAIFSCKEIDTNGSIEGKIVDAKSDSSIKNVAVSTLPPTESLLSDSSGFFKIENVSPDSYQVIFKKSGYYSANLKVLVKEEKRTVANQILEKNFFPENHLPSAPSDPSPKHLETGTKTSTNFSWFSSDSDGDTLTYWVYLDSVANPTKLETILKYKSRFDKIGLTASTNYFWKVVVADKSGEKITGPIWKFKTGN